MYILIENHTTILIQKYTTCQKLTVALTKEQQKNYGEYGCETRNFKEVFSGERQRA